jgi:hypothetical protein
LDRVNRSEGKSILDTFETKIKETEAQLERQEEEFEQISDKYKEDVTPEDTPKTDNSNLASFFDSII